MIREASELRAAARNDLSGKWGEAVIVTLVYLVINGAVGSLGSLIVLLLLPMSYGFAVLFLDLKRQQKAPDVGRMFDGFKDYGRIFGTLLLEAVYVMLWSLLLLIPGIIKSFSYALTPFILKDHPELKYNEAIELSMAMMDGHKFDLFYLCLTFIGWMLLSAITFGIGLLWLEPYMYTSFAHFYDDVKAEYEAAHA